MCIENVYIFHHHRHLPLLQPEPDRDPKEVK